MITMMSSMFWFSLLPLFSFVDGQIATCGVGDATPFRFVLDEDEDIYYGFRWEVRQLGVVEPIINGQSDNAEFCLDPSGCYFVRIDHMYYTGNPLGKAYSVFYDDALIFSECTFNLPFDSINFGNSCPLPEPSQPPTCTEPPVFSPDSEPQGFPGMAPGSKPVKSPTSSNNDVLTCSCTGDPNYKMWNNEYFSFQGNCDQILIDNNYLQLQVRTRPSDNFSLISQVALKLKNPDRTIFRFNRGNKPVITRYDAPEFEYETKNEEFFYAQNRGIYRSPFPTHTFTFNEGERDQYIKVTETWHGGFGVNVQGHKDLFGGSKGMCGNWNAGGMTKRGKNDGVITVTTTTAINAVRSWQVRVEQSSLDEPSTYCEDFTEHCNDESFPDASFNCYDEGLRMLQDNQENSTVTPMSDLECGDLSCAAITDPTMRGFCQSDVRVSGDPRWACQIDYLISDVVIPDPCEFDVEQDTSKFLRGRKDGSTKIRTCGWLKKRKDKGRSRLCTRQVHYFENVATGEVLAPPQIACPDTCASCDLCFENPKTKYAQYNEGDTPTVYKNCNWLAKRSPEKVKRICNRFQSAGGYPPPIKACPVTCGVKTCVL